MREEFLAWVERQLLMANSKSTIRSDANRLERYYVDFDEAYDRDLFASLLAELTR